MVLEGINKPYVYVGCWKSLFAWHKEDLDLQSINYLHFGKPKYWYSIPPAYSERFENFMKFHYHEQFRNCREFLRHKTAIVSPKIIHSNGIPIQKTIQNPGDFIIVFPRTYHSGFNSGFNCAEAVNFATPSWIELGKKAGRCQC